MIAKMKKKYNVKINGRVVYLKNSKGNIPKGYYDSGATYNYDKLYHKRRK